MYQIAAYVIGSRKRWKWTFQRECDADDMLQSILNTGFSELDGDRPLRRFYPAHRIKFVEKSRVERE